MNTAAIHSRHIHAKTKGPADAAANPLISHWARQASNLGPTGYEPAALTN